MLHLLQIYKMIENKDYFISIFDDLSFELENMGYKDCPEDLVDELLDIHFGIYMESETQLKMLTDCILKKQGQMNFLKALPWALVILQYIT